MHGTRPGRVAIIFSVAIAMTGGCSLIAGRPPARPPAGYECPEGVIVADAIGAATTGLLAAVSLKARIDNDSNAAIFAAYLWLPMAILSVTYIGSASYGVRNGRACERALANRVEEPPPPPSPPSPRELVVADRPLYCMGSTPSACFVDEAACAERAATVGATCEARISGACFDAVDVVGTKQMVCAASTSDCEARRDVFARDRTMTLTGCGVYVMKTPASTGEPTTD